MVGNLTFAELLIFNASHNEFSHMLWYFSKHIPEIVEIDLSYNKLNGMNLGLTKLQKLRRVHLSHNNFTYVNMQHFDLHPFNYIDLKSNHIESVTVQFAS